VLAAAALLADCAAQPSPSAGSAVVSSSAVTSAVVSTETQSLTAAEIRQVMSTNQNAGYILGPNDVVGLTVYRHPELSVPPGTVSGASGLPGAIITGDGFATFPLIGNVQLGGMTIGQAQQALQSAYAVYVKYPQVSLELIQAQSLRYYLLGTFTSPGVKYPGHELPLLEALALGGSVDLPHADLYQAYVTQGSVKLPVDLHALLVNGDLSQNITLASGDSIVVPSADSEKAYVFGAVGTPGAVDFDAGSLSLLAALSSAGMDLKNYTDARLAQVRVIRAHGATAEFFVIDASRIMNGEAAPFDLLPGDVVFVPPTVVATWNQALAELIPSLQTVSLALDPFVSIRYLETAH
jgi:polysaccharide export outer membrane protein